MSPISVTVVALLAAGAAAAADRAPTSARSASLSVRVVVLPHRDPRLYEPMPAEPVVDESRAPHLALSRNLSIKDSSGGAPSQAVAFTHDDPPLP
jgi:hypothetical protein